jgi:Fusaric acid resistance protein family
VPTPPVLALARVECTLIGVVVATFVVGLTTLSAARDVLCDRVRRLAADALHYAGRLLHPAHESLSRVWLRAANAILDLGRARIAAALPHSSYRLDPLRKLDRVR